MGLKDVDIEGGLRRLADRKIEEAIRDGKFDNLQGKGKPLDLEPMPAEENARLRWWALRILKQNDFTPDEIRWRKRIDTLKEELDRATNEAQVRALVAAINGIVRQLNTLGTNALQTPVAPVSLDRALEALRQRTESTSTAVPFAQLAKPAEPPSAATPPAAAPDPSAPRIRTCGNRDCGTRNPLSAQFCRRCGTQL